MVNSENYTELVQYVQNNLGYSIIFGIIILLARWLVYKKAGKPGWFSIIPIFSEYEWFKMAGMNGFLCLLGTFGSFLGYLAESQSNNTMGLIALAIMFAAGIIFVVSNFKISKKFGHGFIYGLGLSLIPPIFDLILGFGNSKYQA